MFNLKNLKVDRPSSMAFQWSHKILTWYLILQGQKFTEKKSTISIIWSGWSIALNRE